jgi:carbon monoxide dehydrogenase subunit G
MVAFLAIGFLLPGSWDAEAEATLRATPAEVLAQIDSPEGWSAWTPWPDSTTRSGPAHGAGAAIEWDSRELGSGSFRIVEASPRGVAYAVTVAGSGGSAMETHGTIRLDEVDGATRVTWSEEGDLGSNPLMGYWALTMDRAQGAELQKSLDRLAEVLREAVGSG